MTPSTSSTPGATTPAYALECLRAAVTAGAENVTLCDTNGASLPHEIASATATVVEEFGKTHPDASIGIHTHNDAECGVANSLAAVDAGADLVQGTVNGHGERCGNANLISILGNLQLKMGFDVVGPERIRLLTETSHFVDELLNVNPDPDQAYVGRNAFAHKGGMHVAGIQADARTFEHLDPALVGNGRDVLISELSGKGSVLSEAEAAGIDLDADAAKRALEHVKEREHRGYQYEAADASFELLLRREAGQYSPLFRLESFRVITEKRADGHVETEATIKIWVDGHRYVRTAEGNGPVNALDKALRLAITRPPPAPRRHRAHRLQGAHPRLARRHRRDHPRPPRLLRRPRLMGHDRRLGEHHRGLVGGARRVARVRVPAGGCSAASSAGGVGRAIIAAMSEQDVEIVRRAFADFQAGMASGNPAGAFDAGTVSPDMKWILPRDAPGCARSIKAATSGSSS